MAPSTSTIAKLASLIPTPSPSAVVKGMGLSRLTNQSTAQTMSLKRTPEIRSMKGCTAIGCPPVARW